MVSTRGIQVVDERELGSDPIAALRAWLAEAQRAADRPQVMTLATATPDGLPSARIVLLRGVDEGGLVFFTNRESRKGEELQANPRAAVVLHWWDRGGRSASRGPWRRSPDPTRPRTGRRGPAQAGSRAGSPRSRARSPTARSSTRPTPTPRRASREETSPSRTTGAGTASCRTPSSSGAIARAACTTGSASPRAPGGWRRDRLAP